VNPNVLAVIAAAVVLAVVGEAGAMAGQTW
jgi:hypothetical protein